MTLHPGWTMNQPSRAQPVLTGKRQLMLHGKRPRSPLLPLSPTLYSPPLLLRLRPPPHPPSPLSPLVSLYPEMPTPGGTWCAFSCFNVHMSFFHLLMLCFSVVTSWAGQDAQNRQISLCPAKFFEFGPESVTRDSEQARRDTTWRAQNKK